jgi:hypothetical protein
MTWIPIAAAAVSAAGSLVSGISQYGQGKSQARYADANAGIAEQQADSQAAVIREKARRLSGQNRAAIGASGVDISGSFLDALADSDIDAELDAQTALWNGKLEAMNQRGQAKAARAVGTSALVGGIFGAGTSALSGYSNWYQASALQDIKDKMAAEAFRPKGNLYPHAERLGF